MSSRGLPMQNRIGDGILQGYREMAEGEMGDGSEKLDIFFIG